MNLPVPEGLWSVVALLAVGAMFWIPRFEERLPGGLAPCPAAPPARVPGETASGELSGEADLPGALGRARLVVAEEATSIERTEEPVVLWVLAPLAFLVGSSLAFLAGAGALRRRWRPKALVLYLASLAVGARLSWLALRVAGFEQAVRVEPGSVRFSTTELWGLKGGTESLNGAARVGAWGGGNRYDLYATPKPGAKALKGSPSGAGAARCGKLLRARWVEPELLAALNRALDPPARRSTPTP